MTGEHHPLIEERDAENGQVTRRHLFLLGAGTLALLASAACNKEPATCTDVSGIKPDEAQMRVNMEYQDHSPQADKTCEKCIQFVAAPSREQCASCKVLKGPIHPNGYCKLFAAKT